ncbi:class I SAM-dependent methyltransferase [Bradyrhizobium sp. UFLA05-153]
MRVAREETWGSFWAKKLRIDFFDGKWDQYTSNADSRAAWLQGTFGLDKTKPILSCGCGEGGHELALARRGYEIKGIDVEPTFVQFANQRAAAEGLSATFDVGDLRTIDLGTEQYGAVVSFDTFGLMSRDEEDKLVGKMARATGDSGIVLIDNLILECWTPKALQPSASTEPYDRWWKMHDGELATSSRVDEASRTQFIDLMFVDNGGDRIVLRDPYDRTRASHTGVERYLYEQNELSSVMSGYGLKTHVYPHQRYGCFMVAGRKQFQV